MNYGRGAAAATVIDVRNRILDNPDRGVLSKIEDLTEINNELYSRDSQPSGLGSLVRSAMGAALGVGIARGIGAVMGLGSSFQNKLETAAMGIGALMKSAVEDPQTIAPERQVFRVAFIKAAVAAGYFKEAAGVGFSAVSLSPGLLMSVPQAAGNALMLGGRTVGAGLGAIDAPSSDDEQEAQLEATRDLLRQRLAQAKALTTENHLRRLLAKRTH